MKINDSAEHFEITGSELQTDKYFAQKLDTPKEVRLGFQNQTILVCVRMCIPKKLVSLLCNCILQQSAAKLVSL